MLGLALLWISILNFKGNEWNDLYSLVRISYSLVQIHPWTRYPMSSGS